MFYSYARHRRKSNINALIKKNARLVGCTCAGYSRERMYQSRHPFAAKRPSRTAESIRWCSLVSLRDRA